MVDGVQTRLVLLVYEEAKSIRVTSRGSIDDQPLVEDKKTLLFKLNNVFVVSDLGDNFLYCHR